MPALKNKTILILSPQSWGKMFVSKHHYAVELARYGNTVYFLNPPEQEKKLKERISVEKSEQFPGLSIIYHQLPFPYRLKFHLIPLFHFFMKWHVKQLLNAMEIKPDIIWSFDLGNLYPFSLFPANTIKIFHPVDEPLNDTAINSAKGADIFFSVTKEILNKYAYLQVPGFLINHGVSRHFFENDKINVANGNEIRIGISGNFLRQDIDRAVLLQIIAENPKIIFECWGSYKVAESNIGGVENEETNIFVEKLFNSDNVKLNGMIPAHQLAKEIQSMDAFLISYDIQKDQSKGTNYHKVLEYLSTGKVIITNNISTYKDSGNLLAMTMDRNSNAELPPLFTKVINELELWNNPELVSQRKNLAAANSYLAQLMKIESLLVKNHLLND